MRMREQYEETLRENADLRAELAKVTAERDECIRSHQKLNTTVEAVDLWQDARAEGFAGGYAQGVEDSAVRLTTRYYAGDYGHDLAAAIRKLQPPAAQGAPSQAAALAGPATTVNTDGAPMLGEPRDAAASEGEYSETDSGTLQPVGRTDGK